MPKIIKGCGGIITTKLPSASAQGEENNPNCGLICNYPMAIDSITKVICN